MNTRLPSLTVLSAVLLVGGCDTVTRQHPDRDGGGGVGGADTASGGVSGGGGGNGGGSATGGSAGVATVPEHHRPSAVACNTEPRAPFPSCQKGASAFVSSDCATDADCTAGLGGRCQLITMPPGPSDWNYCRCSYDKCGSDADCTFGGPCACATGARTTEANTCLPGNCRTDGDCGPGGYCSPSRAPGAVIQRANDLDDGGYYCHTQADACVNDADCHLASPWGSYCAYDAQKGAWACMSYFTI